MVRSLIFMFLLLESFMSCTERQPLSITTPSEVSHKINNPKLPSTGAFSLPSGTRQIIDTLGESDSLNCKIEIVWPISLSSEKYTEKTQDSACAIALNIAKLGIENIIGRKILLTDVAAAWEMDMNCFLLKSEIRALYCNTAADFIANIQARNWGPMETIIETASTK